MAYFKHVCYEPTFRFNEMYGIGSAWWAVVLYSYFLLGSVTRQRNAKLTSEWHVVPLLALCSLQLKSADKKTLLAFHFRKRKRDQRIRDIRMIVIFTISISLWKIKPSSCHSWNIILEEQRYFEFAIENINQKKHWKVPKRLKRKKLTQDPPGYVLLVYILGYSISSVSSRKHKCARWEVRGSLYVQRCRHGGTVILLHYRRIANSSLAFAVYSSCTSKLLLM